MHDHIQYDQIEEYLKGTLDKEATIAFEHQLNVDEVLSQEVSLYKKIRAANQDKDLSDLDAKLQVAYDNTIKAPTKKFGSKTWIWTIGAILLLVLLYFILTPPTPAKPQEIYAQFAQHDFSFQEMSSPNELAAIQVLLEAAQYNEALTKLNIYLSQYPDELNVQLIKGISLLEIGQMDGALKVFTFLKAQNSLYESEATWYIALTFLKQEKIAACSKTLQKILSDSSRYPEAQQLIQLLSNIR